MAWQVFATLASGNQPASLFDTLSGQIAKCVVVPCTATGTNAITLAGTTNAPAIPSYSDLVQFSFVAAATSTGTVTIQFGALAALNVYFADGVTQVGSGGILSGQPYLAIFSQALNSGMGGFFIGQQVQRASGTQPTRQVFTSGSSATYTTPANCKQLVVRMIGGGASGGVIGAGGTAGNATSFGTFTANGGSAGGAGSNASNTGGAGGAGGTGGSGSASVRLPGGAGAFGMGATTDVGVSVVMQGGIGGSGPFGGGSNGAGATNSGAGGGGLGNSAANSTNSSAGGGGAGEYVEVLINTPAATYTYTVGAAATVGGGNSGAAGIIIVEERY